MSAPNIYNARWSQDETRTKLVLLSGDREVEIPAMAIWEAQFEKSQIEGFETQAPSEDLPNLKFSRFPLEVGLMISGSGLKDLSIHFSTVTNQTFISLNSIDQTINNGTWYPLDVSLQEALDALDEKGIQVPGKINVGQMIWLKGKDRLDIPVFDSTSIEQIDAADDGFILPEVNAELFPYQKSGVRFLSHISDESLGCILADEMGLGKTLQIISLLAIEKKMGRGPNLVICPATLLENWRRELHRFAPQLSILIHAGAHRTGQPAIFNGFDVVVASYETAIRDEILLSSTGWNVVTLDEAQNIKNPDAQRTRAVKQIPRRNSVAVTGTPVENRLTDLWSIADFALPGLLGDRNSFEASFYNNEADASLLAPLVAPILLRRRILEVAKDLPPRIDIDQALTLTPDMASGYERIRNEIMAQYGGRGSLVAIGKLRQFCAHPDLVEPGNRMPVDENPKYRRLLEVLEEIFEAGEKVLIFTSYLDMSDLITSDLPKRFPHLWVRSIDGRVPVEMRQPMIDDFSNHKGPGAFVLNPIAAGTGLNITAANHVIHYNPEWNPALEDQASARAYRRTQTRPVTVHHFFYADTVEDVIMARLLTKRGIAREAVTGHEGDEDSLSIARAMEVSPLRNVGGMK